MKRAKKLPKTARGTLKCLEIDHEDLHQAPLVELFFRLRTCRGSPFHEPLGVSFINLLAVQYKLYHITMILFVYIGVCV